MFGVKTRVLSFNKIIKEKKKIAPWLKKINSELDTLKINELHSDACMIFPLGNFLKPNFIEKFTKYLKSNDEYRKVLDNADRICRHEFPFFKSFSLKLTEDINWLKDPFHKIKWPSFYKEYIPISMNQGVDILSIWELNRFNHIFTLGAAYRLTGKDKYKSEFKKEIKSWIKSVPRNRGPHWLDAMEVSLRAINWIWGFILFYDEREHDDKFWHRYLKTLYLDAYYIYTNLPVRKDISGKEIKHNHYLISIVGLLILGLFFKKFFKGDEWFTFGKQELFKETVHQFPDGINFEGSLAGYHQLGADAISFSIILLDRIGEKVPEEIRRIVSQSLQFIDQYCMPDGNAPAIGDSSELSFLNWDNIFEHSPKDQKNLVERLKLWTSEIQLNDCHYLSNYIMFFDNESRIEKELIKPLSQDQLLQNGYGIVKNKGNYFLTTFHTSCSDGFNNHKHNDVLHFILMKDYKLFVVDPGTFAYTSYPGKRNLFRSVQYHNTLIVNNEEIIPFDSGRLFRMENWVEAELINYSLKENEVYFHLRHNGYTRLPEKIIHEREFFIQHHPFSVKIQDTINSIQEEMPKENVLHLTLQFHFHPDVQIQINENNSHSIKGLLTQQNVELEFSIHSSGEIKRFHIKDYFYSPSYLRMVKAQKIILEYETTKTFEITSIFGTGVQ